MDSKKNPPRQNEMQVLLEAGRSASKEVKQV